MYVRMALCVRMYVCICMCVQIYELEKGYEHINERKPASFDAYDRHGGVSTAIIVNVIIPLSEYCLGSN